MTRTDRFGGRTVLVTGAAGDIGRAVAERLAAEGATVAAADLPRVAAGLDETVSRCAGTGGGPHVAVPFDVTVPAAVEQAVTAVTEQAGAVQLLVNCAGYQGLFLPAHAYPADDVARVLAVNVAGLVDVTRAVTSRLVEQGLGGAVVSIASHAAVGGPPNMPAYAASKAAIIGYTRAAARDLAPHGIRVNTVSPAFIGPGALWDRQVALQAAADGPHYPDDPGDVAEQMVGQVPLGRLGSPDEVADVVAWLLSEDSSYVTGEDVLVTGGI